MISSKISRLSSSLLRFLPSKAKKSEGMMGASGSSLEKGNVDVHEPAGREGMDIKKTI